MERKLTEIGNQCKLLEMQLGSMKGGDKVIVAECNGLVSAGQKGRWTLDEGSYLVEISGVVNSLNCEED